MTDFKTLELPALIDLLSVYTSSYTKMLTETRKPEELKNYKQTIRLLQSEIRSRKNIRDIRTQNS